MNESDSTIKVSKILVNFIYDEILTQFLKMKGNCKETTFNLIACVTHHGNKQLLS